MNEGWFGENYWVLFSDSEADVAAERYGMANLLPGFHLVGLLGWDEFIVRSPAGAGFRVPTVPCDSKHLDPVHIPAANELVADNRFNGKVKWYLKPLAFGGDPTHGDNLTWISQDQHCDLVRWWNGMYRDSARQQTTK